MSNTNICEYCKMEEGWCMCEEGSKDKQIRQLKRDLDEAISYLCVAKRNHYPNTNNSKVDLFLFKFKLELDDSCVTNRESFLCRSKEQGLSDLEVG